MRRMLTPALAVGFALVFGMAAPANAQAPGQVVTPSGSRAGHHGHHRHAYVRPHASPRAYGGNPVVRKHHGHHRHGHNAQRWGHSGRRW